MADAALVLQQKYDNHDLGMAFWYTQGSAGYD